MLIFSSLFEHKKMIISLVIPIKNPASLTNCLLRKQLRVYSLWIFPLLFKSSWILPLLPMDSSASFENNYLSRSWIYDFFRFLFVFFRFFYSGRSTISSLSYFHFTDSSVINTRISHIWRIIFTDSSVSIQNILRIFPLLFKSSRILPLLPMDSSAFPPKISRILPLLPNKFLLLHLNLAFSYRFTLNTRNCHILIHAGLLLVLSKTQPKRLLLFTSHSHFQIWENITI